MRFVWMLPLVCLGGFVACATDASDTSNDGGPDDDAPIVPYDGGTYDSTAYDAGIDNYIPPFDATPYDSGLDELPPPPDANPCNLNAPCDPNQFPPSCPFFTFCENAAWDAGPPPDGGEAGPPPPKGVCLGIDPGMESCADGFNHCDAGERCLVGSNRCLHAAEVACVCNNPSTAGACGPP